MIAALGTKKVSAEDCNPIEPTCKESKEATQTLRGPVVNTSFRGKHHTEFRGCKCRRNVPNYEGYDRKTNDIGPEGHKPRGIRDVVN